MHYVKLIGDFRRNSDSHFHIEATAEERVERPAAWSWSTRLTNTFVPWKEPPDLRHPGDLLPLYCPASWPTASLLCTVAAVKRMVENAWKIIKDFNHPARGLFDLLPSGRCYRTLQTKTSRFRNSCFHTPELTHTIVKNISNGLYPHTCTTIPHGLNQTYTTCSYICITYFKRRCKVRVFFLNLRCI